VRVTRIVPTLPVADVSRPPKIVGVALVVMYGALASEAFIHQIAVRRDALGALDRLPHRRAEPL